jgi:4-amino-4-deoxy-L-arabinose transferase-like glycosyltransferase
MPDTRRALPAWSLIALAAATAFAVLSLVRGRFAFYEDEGMNLQQAAAVAAGHRLYSEVYSDQAPLYRWFLAGLLRLLGPSSVVVDAVAPAWGALVVAAAAGIANEFAGRRGAVLTALILLGLVPFLKFGSTLVVGIPALALACTSLLVLLRAGSSRARLLASGLLVGAAVGVKAATLYFLPVLAAGWAVRAREPRRLGGDIGVWSLAMVAPVAVIAALCPLGPMLHQVVAPHAASFVVSAEQAAQARRTMLLAPGLPLLYLAAAGGLVALSALGHRASAVLLVWNVVLSIWMLAHRPLWAHHLPDLLVPLALTIAVGTARLSAEEGTLGRLALLLPACGAVGLVLHWTTLEHWRRFYDNSSPAALRALALELQRLTPPERPVLVDRPILAFWAGRPTPPALTLIVGKRISAGDVRDRDLVASIDRDRPSAVVLCKSYLDRFAAFQARLQQGYGEPRLVVLPSSFGHYDQERCRVFTDRGAGPAGRGRRERRRMVGRPPRHMGGRRRGGRLPGVARKGGQRRLRR